MASQLLSFIHRSNFAFASLVIIVSLILSISGVHADSATWAIDADGSWSNDGSWSAPYPQGANEIATFGPLISGPRQVRIDDTEIPIGGIVFQSSHSYTITGGDIVFPSGSPGTLTVDESSSAAQIIAVPLVLERNLTIDQQASALLRLEGPISGAFQLQKTAPARCCSRAQTATAGKRSSMPEPYFWPTITPSAPARLS